MGLQHYTLADFRKKTKEAFDNAEDGYPTFITRHGVRYELKKADIQGYAAQDAAIKAAQAAKNHQLNAAIEASQHMSNAVVVSEEQAEKLHTPGEASIDISGNDIIDSVNAMNDHMNVPRVPNVPPIYLDDIFDDPMPLNVDIDNSRPLTETERSDREVARKNFASDADASYDRPLDLGDSSPILMAHLKKARAERDKIDIDTQDPDEVERGSELTALIDEIETELARRGSKS